MIVLSFIINGVNCLQEPKVALEALQTALFEAVIAAEAMHLPEPMDVDEWIEEAANVEKSNAIPNIACKVCLNFFFAPKYTSGRPCVAELVFIIIFICLILLLDAIYRNHGS